MTYIPTNPLDPKEFYAQNVVWVTESAKLLRREDITGLHRDIARRAMQARLDLAKLNMSGVRTKEDRRLRAELHQTLQVCVPALRRITALVAARSQGVKADTRAAASRLAIFLLGMVAQSSLFPKEGDLESISAQFETPLTGGLTMVNRSVALNILRDNAALFGACPPWVELVVVNPVYMSADRAMKDAVLRAHMGQRIALRNKIIDLGVLTADEEQLLMRVL